MGRPIYPHEMCDPDFAWLVSNYKEQHSEYFVVESTFLPVTLIAGGEKTEKFIPLALPDPDAFLKEEPEA